MLSKSMARATGAVLALLASACALPWKSERPGNVNLAFVPRQNLLELTNVRVSGRSGRFVLGTAAPATVIDTAFHTPGPQVVTLGSRNSVTIEPRVGSLGGVADAIIGADAWREGSITIDYRAGVLTWRRQGAVTSQMEIFRFTAAPAIEVTVNGVKHTVVVDTASPDTLTLPGREARRGAVHVVIAGSDFGTVDVQYASVTQARVGNRLLTHFLVTIDYGQQIVGLWRDPRAPRLSRNVAPPALK